MTGSPLITSTFDYALGSQQSQPERQSHIGQFALALALLS